MSEHYKKITQKEHGGITSREYYQTDETRWYEDKKKWKGLATFGMVKKKLEKPDETVEEKRYYISSLPVDVEPFSKAARGHWGVENQLHWHLDFTFKDDYWYYVKKKYKLKVNFSYNIPFFSSSQFFHLIQFLFIHILISVW